MLLCSLDAASFGVARVGGDPVSAVRPMVREDVFGEFLLLGSVVILEEDFP